MFRYILKRILIFIPTLIAISLLTFLIGINAPGDPVELMLNQTSGESQLADKLAGERVYNSVRKELGLDLPVFYFLPGSLASSDTLHRIPKKFHRENLQRLISIYGNWPEIQKYYQTLRKLELGSFAIQKDTSNADALIVIKENVNNLLLNYEDTEIKTALNTIDSLTNSNQSFNKLIALVNSSNTAYDNVKSNSTKWKNYIPVVHFYGKNQYHRWIFGDGNWLTGQGAFQTRGIIRGDFGKSYQDKRKISTVLGERIKWTLLISFISILLTYLIAIPVGVYSAVRKGSLTDSFSSTLLFILYSLPSFWVATLLIMFLGGGDYLDWFPTYGLGELPENASMMEVFRIRGYHLILPVLCWTYGSFAFLSRQMRGAMLAVIQQDYIKTARAKGLSEKFVIWKHALRNSLLPVITLFANVFPLMIGGSVVLEFIFTIPGMGKWGYDAIIFKDYPVVFTVMILAAALTMTGYLVADILYAVADPRISYTGKK